MEESSSSLTSRLVQQAFRGDKAALQRVMSAVYLELRDRARAVRRKGPRCSMQTGSLIHEAFLKMVKQDGATLKNRAHFIAIATIQMRRVLLDHARARRAAMRGGGAARVELTEVALPADAMGKALDGDGSGEQRLVDSVDLDRCLTRLEKASPQAGQVVSMRILGGASMEDIAEVMGVTRQTVHKHWKVGQAWLVVCLKRDGRRN